MTITGIHYLLTYTCNFECDHCFLYCSPRASGTFTIGQVKQTLDEAVKAGSIDSIFFEGGEPFLYYPLLKESIAMASARGFKTGVVTNAYGCTSPEDTKLWLEPLAKAGLNFLSVSNDAFHYGDEQKNPAAIAAAQAKTLNIDISPICIDPPEINRNADKQKGEPVVGGGVRFRGRAVEKLTNGLPTSPWETMQVCPDEDLAAPSRVHIDPLGEVHLCQGISMGNWKKTHLSKIFTRYNSQTHPIAGPLIRGGPAELARATGFSPAKEYVENCHLCFDIRRHLLDQFPQFLAPTQVYGIS
ncbi:MAG: radical SAM protein [Desulfobacterales bacterium]|nr:radical SAM protein [Desulfobacterales bacterium]